MPVKGNWEGPIWASLRGWIGCEVCVRGVPHGVRMGEI